MLLAQVRDELVERRRVGSGARDDDRGRALAERVVGHADHRHLGDLRVAHEQRLQLGRRDVHAAADR